MEEIVDLDPYLRPATSSEKSDDSSRRVLTDPKSWTFLDEWEKHLETTITNLHAKIRTLEEKNSMLEMDARLGEIRMAKLKEKAGEGPAQPISNKSTTSVLSSAGLNIPDAIQTVIKGGRQKNVPDISPSNLTSNDQDGMSKLQNSRVSMSHNDSNSNSSRIRKFSDTRTVEKELAEMSPYRGQYETLIKRCQDYEQSLKEVGAQLRVKITCRKLERILVCLPRLRVDG